MDKFITFSNIFILVLAFASVIEALESRQTDSRQGRLKINENDSETKCGSQKDLAKRIEGCARILVDILQGSLVKWPKNPSDMGTICGEIFYSFGICMCVGFRKDRRSAKLDIEGHVRLPLATTHGVVSLYECSIIDDQLWRFEDFPENFPYIERETFRDIENSRKPKDASEMSADNARLGCIRPSLHVSTSTRAFATAVARTRKRECLPKNHINTFKAIQCAEKNQQTAHAIMYNVTDHLRIITDQIEDLDLKTTAVCCMIGEIEQNIKVGLGAKCGKDALVITRLYRSTLEDVNNLICRSPKCVDIFKGYTVRETKQYDGVISLLIQIIFSIA